MGPSAISPARSGIRPDSTVGWNRPFSACTVLIAVAWPSTVALSERTRAADATSWSAASSNGARASPSVSIERSHGWPYWAGVSMKPWRLAANVSAATTPAIAAAIPKIVVRTGTALFSEPRSTAKRTPRSVVAPKSQCSACGASRGGSRWIVYCAALRSARQPANANAPTTAATTTTAPMTSIATFTDHPGCGSNECRRPVGKNELSAAAPATAPTTATAAASTPGRVATVMRCRSERPRASSARRSAASWSTCRAAAWARAMSPASAQAPAATSRPLTIALRVLSSVCAVSDAQTTSGTSARDRGLAIRSSTAALVAPGARRNSTPANPAVDWDPASSVGPTYTERAPLASSGSRVIPTIFSCTDSPLGLTK